MHMQTRGGYERYVDGRGRVRWNPNEGTSAAAAPGSRRRVAAKAIGGEWQT